MIIFLGHSQQATVHRGERRDGRKTYFFCASVQRGRTHSGLYSESNGNLTLRGKV